MRYLASHGLLLSSVACASHLGFAPTDQVPLLGPSFLSNFDPTNATAVQKVKEAFPKAIEALFEKKRLNKTNLNIAVDIFSAATNQSIFNYYHAGEKQTLTSTLDDNTISRIGSVSKLFTAYAIIAKAGIEVFRDPVTKYLPELASTNSSDDPLKHVRWEDVTIGGLASHQAGSGGAAGLLVASEYPEKLGPEDLFAFMRAKHPVTSPFRTAVYSDGGFTILAQVLERLSGKKYPDAIRDILFKPLGRDGLSTSTTAPNGSDINTIDRRPVSNSTAFALDLPIVAGSGGIYTNGADLRAIGLSILNSQILSAATTQQWMKPLSGTGSLVELVGAPWEIHRLAIPVTSGSNKTRISDLYTKAGGNGDYNAIFALSPDHGIGFSILVTGSTSATARFTIRDLVGEMFIPACEAAAAENAKRNLAGTFVSTNSTKTNITLTVDEGQPGLGLASIYLEGEESSALIQANSTFRLFPTGLNSYSRSLAALYRTKGTMRVAHRLISYSLPYAPRATSEGGDGGLFDNQYSWMGIDFVTTVDEFIFTVEEGKLIAVENTGSGLSFKRA
ncbi:beta-lactamase [Byssothecium circinans]|uniref:Beta-lactamase n=1 Tax=Byssothecium circinans TaxID=147558 RepID=A0A6A5TGX6_9PLEO|nr:beta-lactamase [Byssothecium circinans]